MSRLAAPLLLGALMTEVLAQLKGTSAQGHAMTMPPHQQTFEHGPASANTDFHVTYLDLVDYQAQPGAAEGSAA